jgi:probable F420-dependent oxidoreductase
MGRPLLVGIQLPEVEYEVSAPEMLAMARTAEAVGFDSIWVGDHLLFDLPVGARGPWEAWTSLAAIAAVTQRVLIGPLVAAMSFHQPQMMAKQAATIDAISGGRLIVGVGAGWNEREYRAFGFPFDNRVSRFDEAFTIVRTLLQTGVIDFDGAYYRAENCILHPRPSRPGGPPLLVGSFKPRMLSIALPHAYAWNAWYSQYQNTPEGFVKAKAKADENIAALGYEPSTVDATCAVAIQLPGGLGRQEGDDEDGLTAVPFQGSPQEIADLLRAFAAAGAKHVQLVVDPITRASIEFFAEVLAILDA